MAIKKLQNDFTTPEQSKRLLELGVPADSANCYFLSTDGITTWVRGVADKYMNWFGTIDKTPIPCWSVGRLIEIIGICAGMECVDFETLAWIQEEWSEKLIKLIDGLMKYNKIDFSKLEE